MKSYILHGENQPQLHKVLIQLIEQAKVQELDIVRLDGKKCKENDIRLAARSQGLISMGTLVIVDNFFSNNKKASEFVKELSIDSTSYIFVENKILPPSTLKSFQKSLSSGKQGFVVQAFPIPTALFNFLNSITPGITKLSIEQLKKVTEHDSDEFLFIMLARHVRNLIWVKEDYQSFKGADWQKQKLLSQANKFSNQNLRDLHTRLLDLDRMNKRSQLPENLGASLEVLVASL